MAQRLDRRRIGLDCLVGVSGSAGSPEPLYLRVRGATLFWGSTSLDEVVLRWVESGHRVWVDIAGGPHPRVTLCHGESVAVLELQDLAAARRLSGAPGGARPMGR